MTIKLCLFLTIFVSSALARPQYLQPQKQGSRNPLPVGCRIKYKTVSLIEQREEYEDKCETKYRQQCETKFQGLCNPKREKKCKTESKRKCEIKTKEVCSQLWREVQQAYQEDECKDSYVRKCEKHWDQAADGSKVWVDNPATCKSLKETQCSPVTKYKTVREPYTTCKVIPYQECKNVPYKNCLWVTLEKCNQEPYQDCRDVPYQDCQKVHKLVPYEVSKQRPFRVCGNDEPYEFTDAEINQFEIIEADNDEEDDDDNDNEDFSAIVFSV